ncbi:MAG: glycosyltransferase family 2 protein [Candidatus Pacebacteria bacterium]|nr:glycosyltransferase family 2 protein [Candidatus Paceibacterota bacterium]
MIILSYNSALTIGATLAAAARVSHDIQMVDSGSTDETLAIARASVPSLAIHHHPFVTYGEQRNWASATLPIKGDWELHLDADEELSEGLIRELNQLQAATTEPGLDGYLIPRKVIFMGRAITHGGMYPIWHLRLFRRGQGRCEMRLYDQHFILGTKRLGRLHQPMMDRIAMGLSEWTDRHNRWSSSEAAEQLRHDSKTRPREITPRFLGTAIEQKRAFRSAYDRLPIFLRCWLLFFYRYILKLGFLDGREGLIFFVLQSFWFRFLVDAKIYESKITHGDRNSRKTL